jgi:ATP-binding protein involved in chromosome partitioning
MESEQSLQEPRTIPEDGALSGVRNAIAVASAKGGVGKSTVSVNLALSLARMGLSVGLLDADIYGPSIPLMLGVREEPGVNAENKMIPVERHGVSLISIGLIAGEDMPVIWRGPMLAHALQQFISQVEWGKLDYLIIDLPPGTGDIPLTLSQTVALSGAVMVTTPQDVALQDVERGIAMFEKVEVDLLGVVENMSFYLCPHCGERHEIFSHGGGRKAAERLGIDFLGEVPLHASIRQGGDEGNPVVVATPASPEDRAFAEISARLVEQIRRQAAAEE